MNHLIAAALGAALLAWPDRAHGDTINQEVANREACTAKAIIRVFFPLHDVGDPVLGRLIRAQLNHVKSVSTQFHDHGLTIEYAPLGEKADDPSLRTNFAADYGIPQGRLLSRAKAEAMVRQYEIIRTPAVVILRPDAALQERWLGLATSYQLAAAFQRLSARTGADDWRHPFTGFPAARSVGEGLWLIDDGQHLRAGERRGVRWLIEGSPGGTPHTLIVYLSPSGSPNDVQTSRTGWRQMEKDEIDVILRARPALATEAHLANMDLQLDKSGTYLLRCDILDAEGKLLLNRELHLTVEANSFVPEQ